MYEDDPKIGKFLRSKTKAKQRSRQPTDINEDVLSQMLLDVPPVKKPAITPRVTVNKLPPRIIETNINKIEVKQEPEPQDEPMQTDNVRLEEPQDVSNLQSSDRFYWLDCCENKNVVYFFGKILAGNRYVSCCVVVRNIMRTVYLLIKEGCTYEEAMQEFSVITAKRYKIHHFKCEKVTKRHAFGPAVPAIADYVKLDYPAEQPSLPADLKGETFSHIFNINQAPLEKIILDLKLRGPCWLKLINPLKSTSPITWTSVELLIDDPKQLVVEETTVDPEVKTEFKSDANDPTLCALSISLRAYPNPTTHRNEIIAIFGMFNTTFKLDQCLKRTNKASGHFCIMTKPPPGHKDLRLPYDFQVALKNYSKTRLKLVETERDLLTTFLEEFNRLDPDIVIGHDLLNFDYETLVMRMKVNKVGNWSNLGRFKRTELPSTKKAFRSTFSGRVMCDIRTSAMELIQARSYDLTELAAKVLDRNRVEYNHLAIVEAFKSSDYLIKLLNATWEDNDSIFSIMVELNVIPLALKITNITGNILSRTLAAGRSERNEYLLLHAFHEENFICPEKQVSAFKKFKKANDENEPKEPQTTGRKKAAYAGGLVLEPKSGYYDTCILLMDFNSLYPSIIQEFNICFSTVQTPESDDLANISIPDESTPTGVLPTQLRNLVERRRKVKRLLADCKSADQRMLLDIEQKALKLTANSMYGCLGFEQSRFYAKHLAALVTFKGREILMSTKAMVEKLGYEVIYGDTDSLMIDTKITDYDETLQRGNSIKSEVNRTFKLLEIDIDGVYRPLLLLKKKNYAGVSWKKQAGDKFTKTIETKGLDTVRRDRAVIAKEAGEKVLSMILSGEKDIVQTVEDIHNYLKELGQQIKADTIPVEKYQISKQLNKNPEEYRDTKGLGHVAVALRYNQDNRNTRKKKAGDTMQYIVCSNETTESANQRAYSIEELKLDPKLKIDYEYYICQQIHPVMTRICDVLPVTNAYVLAEMLGVEKSNLLHIKRTDNDNSVRRDQLSSKGASRFNSCKPLVIVCPNCFQSCEITTRVHKNKETKEMELSLSSCNECGVRFAMKSKMIVIQIISLIKQLTNQLYGTKFICENSDCGQESRNTFCRVTPNSELVCDSCGSNMLPELDDRKLDHQLNFIKHLLDAKQETELKCTDDVLDLYNNCYNEVNAALRASAINNIDTYTTFSMVCSGRN